MSQWFLYYSFLALAWSFFSTCNFAFLFWESSFLQFSESFCWLHEYVCMCSLGRWGILYILPVYCLLWKLQLSTAPHFSCIRFYRLFYILSFILNCTYSTFIISLWFSSNVIFYFSLPTCSINLLIILHCVSIFLLSEIFLNFKFL